MATQMSTYGNLLPECTTFKSSQVQRPLERGVLDKADLGALGL